MQIMITIPLKRIIYVIQEGMIFVFIYSLLKEWIVKINIKLGIYLILHFRYVEKK
jgi:hypothetical protein